MFKTLVLAVALFLVPMLTTTAQAGSGMQEGNWEITVSVEMPGVAFTIPPMSYTSCLTKENQVPRDPGSDENCQATDIRIDGDTVTWKVSCKDENGAQVDSRGRITYSGDTFAGEMVSDINDPQEGKMQLTNRMKGRYLGPCSP